MTTFERSWTRAIQASPLLAPLILAAVGAIAGALWIVAGHVNFPLPLTASEATDFQRLLRVAAHQPLYSAPSAEFAPHAGGPLFPVIAWPFAVLFGPGLLSLRVASVTGLAGLTLCLGILVAHLTGSAWRGLVGSGLFAASLGMLEAYPDTAGPDAWFAFLVFAGLCMISSGETRIHRYGGLATIGLASWIHIGGLFALMLGALYAQWKQGWSNAAAPFAAALVAGPGGVIWLGPMLFGPAFLDYALALSWNWSATLLLAGLAAASVLSVLALDALAQRSQPIGRAFCEAAAVALIALAISQSRPASVSEGAATAHADLADLLSLLDGPVYAPTLGYFDRGFRLSPSVNLATGHGASGVALAASNVARSGGLLKPISQPAGTAFLLLDQPLDQIPGLKSVAGTYELAENFGDRYRALAGIGSNASRFPRFLYRFHGGASSEPLRAAASIVSP